jgi:integrase
MFSWKTARSLLQQRQDATGIYMLRDGHELGAVQAQLGWTNLSMASRYTHALADTQDRVAETFEKLFAPSRN